MRRLWSLGPGMPVGGLRQPVRGSHLQSASGGHLCGHQHFEDVGLSGDVQPVHRDVQLLEQHSPVRKRHRVQPGHLRSGDSVVQFEQLRGLLQWRRLPSSLIADK
jgi:hypothetical protein